MRSRLLTAILFLTIPTAVTSSAQTRGSITATVVDRAGQPVVGARVAMVPADAKGIMGILPECLTDDKGICSQSLGFGKYHVTAQKKSDGYPDLLSNFYGHSEWPATAQITPDRPSASVTVQLGPKASIVIHPLDNVSGDTIKRVTITLHPAADPHDFVSSSFTGPDATILIPADEDVLVTVSADGYLPWHLEEHPELSPSGTMRLHSEQRHEMTVLLKHQ
jgi:hypothetical protein